MTKTIQLQRLVEEYRQAGQPWPASRDMIAGWAVEEKKYYLTAPSLKRLVAKELAQAMSEDYFTDKQGDVCARNILLECARGESKWFFGPTFAPRREKTWRELSI